MIILATGVPARSFRFSISVCPSAREASRESALALAPEGRKEGILETHTRYASPARPVDDQQYLEDTAHPRPCNFRNRGRRGYGFLAYYIYYIYSIGKVSHQYPHLRSSTSAGVTEYDRKIGDPAAALTLAIRNEKSISRDSRARERLDIWEG